MEDKTCSTGLHYNRYFCMIKDTVSKAGERGDKNIHLDVKKQRIGTLSNKALG